MEIPEWGLDIGDGYRLHNPEPDTCSLSCNQVWLPALFDSIETAIMAMTLRDETLRRLQLEANKRPDVSARRIDAQMIVNLRMRGEW